ncbi:MAG: hypothetical protein Q9173_006441 [Seirophora scorigena]
MSSQNVHQPPQGASSTPHSPYIQSLNYNFNLLSLEGLRTLARTARRHTEETKALRDLLVTQKDHVANTNPTHAAYIDMFSDGLRDAEVKLNACIALTEQVYRCTQEQFNLLLPGGRRREYMILPQWVDSVFFPGTRIRLKLADDSPTHHEEGPEISYMVEAKLLWGRS